MLGTLPCADRWRKPTHDSLMTQQYHAAYSAEQLLDDDHIQVHTGLGEEVKGSLRGSNVASALQKISLGSRAAKSQQGVDHASLLEAGVKKNMEMDNAGMCLSEVGDDRITTGTTEI